MRRIVSAFISSLASLWLLLCVAPSRAQQADLDRFELRGVLINSVTGEPVSRALVQLNSPEGKMQLTGTDGVFLFTNLSRGQYAVTALKPGFFNEQELGRRNSGRNSIKDIPSDGELRMKLTPEGVIYGEVKNEDGEPIEGTIVKAMLSRVVEGQRMLEQSGEAMANDEGNFRIAELKPGRYRLSFTPVVRAPVVFFREVGRKRQAEQGYAAEFYPGVADAEAATPIEVRAGAQVHVTQGLKRQKLFEVAGVVRGADPSSPFSLMLRDAAGDYVPRSIRIDQKRGQFQIVGVKEGSYLLTARAAARLEDGGEPNTSMLGATQWIHLNSDLTGVVLTLNRVNSLRVQLRDEIPPDGTNAVHQVRVRLISKELAQYAPATLAGGAEGEQLALGRIDDILPGTYSVEAAGFPSGYIASLRYGDKDLLREDLTVAPGSELPPLEVTLRSDGAQLNIAVQEEGQNFAGDVVIYSEEFPKRSVVVQMNGASGLTQDNLAPGRYLVFAVEDGQELEYRNPAKMEKYLGQATEVILQPGDKTSVRVKLQPMEEEQR